MISLVKAVFTMIVCVCNRVSDRDIVKVVRGGIRSFDLMLDETGAASRCGRCRECAREVFDAACAQHGASASTAVASPVVVGLTQSA